ncbi:putative nucleotidyltransferase substrate binding domain-containing protein [Corynebacterium gerontici]|uniref:Nucleotidyltransferase substrate binding domain protein n=1 Tax=Corynebacterium gerontici TaxID=2079234 RepID=A0A3G6IZD9_9CORY|nr:putative nucleotidyltransferase substrate binding domain-containing protein [Corynebacterium gerontici]AZA11016.1 Putative nucleotidyltransferase substrate binding domain protein [Corynebacterium gerontici]
MLHESLQELAQIAGECEDLAMLRGVAAESQVLLRNAIDHDAPAHEIVPWYSKLISDALHSEAVLDATGGVHLVLSGAVGRGDALPSSTITWLAVRAEGARIEHDPSNVIASTLEDLGFVVAKPPQRLDPRPKSDWLHHIDHAEGTELNLFADAGTWALRRVNEREDFTDLLKAALELQPPTVHAKAGMPETAAVLSVRDQLLAPIVGLARWAGACAECPSASTPERLQYAQSAEVLHPEEASLLLEAFNAAQSLELERWAQRVQAAQTAPSSLTAIQRSIFGASARSVADVMRAVAGRHTR